MDILNERILPLFDKSGKSDMELEREIGLPRSIIYDWRNGRSKSFKKYAGEIADYFDVAVNYILGNEQKNKPSDKTESLSQDDIKFLDRLKQLAPGDRDFLSAQIDLLIARQQEKK